MNEGRKERRNDTHTRDTKNHFMFLSPWQENFIIMKEFKLVIQRAKNII
jgi:hypothetical protein